MTRTLPPVRRSIDQRRRKSPFIKATAAKVHAGRFSFAIVTESVKPRAFQTYDSQAGVLVVTGLSDLPEYRAKAARILGRDVVTVYTDMFGTIYQAKLVA